MRTPSQKREWGPKKKRERKQWLTTTSISDHWHHTLKPKATRSNRRKKTRAKGEKMKKKKTTTNRGNVQRVIVDQPRILKNAASLLISNIVRDLYLQDDFVWCAAEAFALSHMSIKAQQIVSGGESICPPTHWRTYIYIRCVSGRGWIESFNWMFRSSW